VTGLFITFEGPDGAGKTTQIKLLAEAAERLGREVVLTREPGGTPVSDQIRSLVLDPAFTEVVEQTEVLLYAASRAQHVHEKIVPALERGCIVLCDRFVDASIAYQGYGLGIDVATVAAINRFATGGLAPHRTYLLDLSPEESLSRLHLRSTGAEFGGLDRIEGRVVEYHQAVRDGFIKIARENQSRVRIVNANRPVADIAAEIAEDFYCFIDAMLMDKKSTTH